MKDGKIKKCVLVDGKFDSGRPKPGDTVLVKVQGKLKDGTIVDDYPTLVFTIGEYEVIDGLDLVVQSMYRNELSIVSIKPEMAYGEQGKNARNLKNYVKLKNFREINVLTYSAVWQLCNFTLSVFREINFSKVKLISRNIFQV